MIDIRLVKFNCRVVPNFLLPLLLEFSHSIQILGQIYLVEWFYDIWIIDFILSRLVQDHVGTAWLVCFHNLLLADMLWAILVLTCWIMERLSQLSLRIGVLHLCFGSCFGARNHRIVHQSSLRRVWTHGSSWILALNKRVKIRLWFENTLTSLMTGIFLVDWSLNRWCHNISFILDQILTHIEHDASILFAIIVVLSHIWLVLSISPIICQSMVSCLYGQIWASLVLGHHSVMLHGHIELVLEVHVFRFFSSELGLDLVFHGFTCS